MLAVLLAVPAVVGAVGVGLASDASVEMTMQPQPRGSILIEGDEEFTRENGVRWGSGTAADPYVISNWTIVADEGDGIVLRDTRAHVVVRHVLLPAADVGIRLFNASNVEIRDLVIGEATTGIDVEEGRDVSVQRSHLGRPDPTSLVPPLVQGLAVVATENLRVANVTVLNAEDPLHLFDGVRNVTVADSAFRSPADFLARQTNAGVSNLSIERTEYEGTLMKLRGVKDAHVVGSGFHHSHQALLGDTSSPVGHDHPVNGLDVCGTVFHNVTTDSENPLDVLQIGGARDVSIRASSFRDNTAGPDIQHTHNVSFVRNEVLDHTVDGLVLFADPGTGSVTFNNFAQNNQGEVIAGSDTNASRNWWGHPSGPNISGENGPGEGEPLRIVGDNVTIDPVLTSPAAAGPAAADCGVPQGAPGVKQTPSFPLEAQASAKAQVKTDADTAVERGSGPIPTSS